MLQGFSLPLSPLGKANVVGAPPWHYSGDVIALVFWTEPGAAAATLPPGLTPDPDSNGRAIAVFADWQYTGANDELLEPARYQNREFYMLLDAHWNNTPVYWTPYVYVDNDSSMARGWIQGYPKRLGSIFQTRTFAAPGPASAPILPGTKFGASLSVHGQRLANGRLTLRQEQADVSSAMGRPAINRRYFPSLCAGQRNEPVVDELVMAVNDDLTIIDIWSGDAELELPKAIGEELHELLPVKMGTGYRLSMSCTISGLKVLQDFAK
jgi:acetoacetate decarboxylase